ncbi:MAG: glycosyltransferase family 4 protein, partial [Pseudohongiella sp.]
MVRRLALRSLYYSCVTAVVLLVAYQVYLTVSGPRYLALHASQVAAIQSQLTSSDMFEFAVVGNVNNSVSIFQNEIIPLINNSAAGFTISAGNAVSSGATENYRSVHRIFSNLENPWLLTYGDNEDSDFGQFTFYDGFGPYFYSFNAANAHFIFLDNTDNSHYNWQLRWLQNELQASTAEHRFVFVSSPLHAPVPDTPAFQSDSYFSHDPVLQELKSLFVEYNVDMVFSSEISVFHDETEDGVRYITTGGAGGVVVDDSDSFHHYVRVSVDGEQLNAEAIRLENLDASWLKTLNSIWAATYAFFYISYSRFLIIVSVLFLLALKLHQLVFESTDYYGRFAIDASAWLGKKKRILYFTNNFFPFISGVTISIERLMRGLRE